MDIRKETRIIIRRGPVFLVARIIGSTEYRWSSSPWSAWGTRDRDTAEAVARRVGGDLWLFNRVAGQLREMGTRINTKGGLTVGTESDHTGADLRDGQPEDG